MTCREIIDFLSQYQAGELPEATRAEFERHLGCCKPCVAYLKTFQRAIELGREACCGGADPPPVPPELVRAIMAALRVHGPDKG